MTAAYYDITIEQGSVFELNLVYKESGGTPIDLTGYSARMQVRKKYSSPDPVLSLSSAAGSISIGGVAGTIDIKAKSELTQPLTIKQGVYDLELIPPTGEDDAFRLVEGFVTVTPEVTRP